MASSISTNATKGLLLEDVINKLVATPLASYSIAGRTIQYQNLKDLVAIQERLEMKAKRESEGTYSLYDFSGTGSNVDTTS